MLTQLVASPLGFPAHCCLAPIKLACAASRVLRPCYYVHRTLEIFQQFWEALEWLEAQAVGLAWNSGRGSKVQAQQRTTAL